MNGLYVGKRGSIDASPSVSAKEPCILHGAKVAAQIESSLMKPLGLLAAVYLLASPAAGMSPACDRIDDPGLRSACHAQDDAQLRAGPPGPSRLQQRLEAADRLLRRDNDPVYLAAMQVRRENCWEWAGDQVAGGSAGPNEKAGRRTDLTQACLAKTVGIPERVAARITTEVLADQFRACMNRLKTKFAADPPIPLDIFIMDACVSR